MRRNHSEKHRKECKGGLNTRYQAAKSVIDSGKRDGRMVHWAMIPPSRKIDNRSVQIPGGADFPITVLLPPNALPYLRFYGGFHTDMLAGGSACSE